MEAFVAVTHRCNARCHMCNLWQNPTRKEDEVTASEMQSLPQLAFAGITGGEPFLREDLVDIVDVLRAKADRIVISTNGYFTERILAMAKSYPDLGFRVSLEGLSAVNDELRGIKDGFDRGLRTVLGLRDMGVKDIGFAVTLSDRNAPDALELYELTESMGVELSTAAVHNSFAFQKDDNAIEEVDAVTGTLEEMARRMLGTGSPKTWFRAWYNMALADFVRGNGRALPCSAGQDIVFIDALGRVMPCNALDAEMGSLKEQTFDEIWGSERADEVRAEVEGCEACWIVCSVTPAMKAHMSVPAAWVAKAKLTGSLPPVS